MRLAVVDNGHAPAEAAVLEQMQQELGREPSGVVKTLYYRPELFGRPFSDALHHALGARRRGRRESESSLQASPPS